ncbi:hypothetical protein AND_006883 [Anopheles darlingi]|uniref:Uncharacterized protein n=1 Tax=Anopheles darlingi TaxID=43151 RepID=W5JAH7_ANODA|nr:hypothetical protein AND_006883 [Anopheles darlingi]
MVTVSPEIVQQPHTRKKFQQQPRRETQSSEEVCVCLCLCGACVYLEVISTAAALECGDQVVVVDAGCCWWWL